MVGLKLLLVSFLFTVIGTSSLCLADENLFGYVRGAEPLPAKSWEIYEVTTIRSGKGAGRYQAVDSETEIEYGFTDRFSAITSLELLSIDTEGLRIDAYLPKDQRYIGRTAGVEAAFKYNFLTPAKDNIGLASYLSVEQRWLDRHSGQRKDSFSWQLLFLVQKYFLEGQLIWVANFGAESTYAHRKAIDDLPDGFEWPTHPEMELEPKFGTGVSYRFIPNWFIGAESLYEAEYETETGLERWTVFAGPNLHYGSERWWATLTWFQQLRGGGTMFDEQDDKSLHLIERTKQEFRFKLGFNF